MKDLRYGYIKRELEFNFSARTSRGEMKTHASYLIWVMHPSDLNLRGWGEAAPLPGLSVEANEDFEELLNAVIELLNEGHLSHELDWKQAPSIQFAIETAQLDLWNGGNQVLFDNPFSTGKPIRINGLVWMDELPKMLEQAKEKAIAGYDCIKFKIGAHDFDAECRMLEAFRKEFAAADVEIRLDANGAFAVEDALHKLKELNRFGIHSIEQPIKAGQPDALEEICAKSQVRIALDEELIGLDPEEQGANLIHLVKPAYLVLKPTLLGGMMMSAKWTRLADAYNIGWWATSALESNVGLNAIAQWVSVRPNPLAQGLGTGQLYKNNIPSPLKAEKGQLHYLAGNHWELPDVLG